MPLVRHVTGRQDAIVELVREFLESHPEITMTVDDVLKELERRATEEPDESEEDAA